MTDNGPLDAGGFSSWLAGMQLALRGEGDADVPCNGCTACCTSSQFVHVGPDETDALAHLPTELLFPAPGLPDDHLVMGYDHRGHCPMLADDVCTVYEHRPRACRTYDCRVLPAAGLTLDQGDKPLVAARVARWRFGHDTDADHAAHAAVRHAADYLDEHRDELADIPVPSNATQLAALGVEIHDLFAATDNPGPADATNVRVAITRHRRP